jgi:hypothetical protein
VAYVSVFGLVALTSQVNERLHIGDLDGVQKEHKRFILVRAKECPTSSGEESLVLPCTEVFVVGGSKLVREGGAPRS